MMSRKKVLILDQELMLENKLRGDTVSLIPASSAQGAINRISSDPMIDGAVLDVGCSDRLAFEAITTLRALRPHVPIVALSEDVFDAGAAIRHGADAFLLKPVQADDVLRLMERLF
jgi:CheY-like chemotaxis protein